MHCTMRPSKPDDIEFELTLNMRLKDWLDLQEQLVNKYPSWELNSKITDMILQAKKVFYPQED